MNDDRYKKLMSDVGMPNSCSLLEALKQVANEVTQELTQWYSVKEMPKDLNKHYLTYGADTFRILRPMARKFPASVTHWKPLPDAPWINK